MREEHVIPFVVLIVAAAAFPVNGQVIANVDRRNPNDVSWMAFVRVAPEPLGDGVPAYADRTHTYQDVPESLLGAEYVLMSNDDKYNPDHELHVTVGQRGTLYLFIDNRVGTHIISRTISPNLAAAGMTWVAEMGFVNTGMKMAVDENADGTIDNYYTVFSKSVLPGVIVLKAQNDMYTGGPHDRNMYGVAAVVRSVADTRGLIGWWRLDGIESGLVLDSSGLGNHGVVLGNPQCAEGRFGGALSFDGVDDYIDCGCDPNLMFVDSVSVAAWIKLGALDGDRKIASNQDGVMGGYKLGVSSDNKVEFEARGVPGSAVRVDHGVAGGTVLKQDVWYYVAGVYERGRCVRTYVNGKLDRELETFDIACISLGPLLLGRELCCGANWWLGLLDDVRLYGKALKADEIEEIMQEDRRITAWNPQPAPGANVIAGPTFAVSWSAGDTAVAHDLYIGTDANAVEIADPISPLYQGRLVGTTFPLQWLVESGGRYFWRVDEVEADDETIHKGDVWTFTVSDHLVVDDFESYTDREGSRIEETWIDGSFNNTGSQVGRWINPSIGYRDRSHGEWSMFLAYDNARPPFVSEVEREFAGEQDWTVGDVNTLSLRFRGDLVSFRETEPGAFAMSATGADIWGAGDQFRYAYRRLDGDGSIVARVERVGNTDFWAKAGVMIRESLDPVSAYAFMLVTPDGLRAFQNRPASYSATCFSAHSWEAVSFPSWVKLERRGDQFTGYHSLDGINWIQQPDTDNTRPDFSPNPQTIRMPPYVYVGLALTSHAAGLVTTATFSDVEITGDILGQWQVAEIGVDQPGNSPCELYVVVEDSAAETAMVIHPDPTVVSATAWTEWEIPLSSFAGVNFRQVRKMCIGVGSPGTAIPDGTGRIYIDDIRLFNR